MKVRATREALRGQVVVATIITQWFERSCKEESVYLGKCVSYVVVMTSLSVPVFSGVRCTQ
jgi:hypothetical protein